MIRRLLVVPLLLFCAPGACLSQAQPGESLRGLHGVFAKVPHLDKDIEAGGLSTQKVQIAVEKALRAARITVYPEPRPDEGSANLIIEISLVKHPQGPFLFGVEVALVQEVQLSRNKGADSFPGKTWTASALGLTTPDRVDVILDAVLMKVNEFVGEFQTANKPGRN